MASQAALAAKRYRRLIKSGMSHGHAYEKALGPDVIDCFPGYARSKRKTAVARLCTMNGN